MEREIELYRDEIDRRQLVLEQEQKQYQIVRDTLTKGQNATRKAEV